MEKAKEGFIDLTRAEELLDFFLQDAVSQGVPNQRYEKGLPPKPGVPCPKCMYRNLAESYTMKNFPVGVGFIGSKPTCDLLIEQLKKQPHRIDPPILNLLILQNEYEEEHVAHVASVITPGTIIFMAFKQANEQRIMCFLIDGTHRAVSALRTGRDFLAYVLVPKETIRCLSYFNGKPNPHFIGKQSNVLFDGRDLAILIPPARDPRS
jgi:hypothetical protein